MDYRKAVMDGAANVDEAEQRVDENSTRTMQKMNQWMKGWIKQPSDRLPYVIDLKQENGGLRQFRVDVFELVGREEKALCNYGLFPDYVKPDSLAILSSTDGKGTLRQWMEIDQSVVDASAWVLSRLEHNEDTLLTNGLIIYANPEYVPANAFGSYTIGVGKKVEVTANLEHEPPLPYFRGRAITLEDTTTNRKLKIVLSVVFNRQRVYIQTDSEITQIRYVDNPIFLSNNMNDQLLQTMLATVMPKKRHGELKTVDEFSFENNPTFMVFKFKFTFDDGSKQSKEIIIDTLVPSANMLNEDGMNYDMMEEDMAPSGNMVSGDSIENGMTENDIHVQLDDVPPPGSQIPPFESYIQNPLEGTLNGRRELWASLLHSKVMPENRTTSEEATEKRRFKLYEDHFKHIYVPMLCMAMYLVKSTAKNVVVIKDRQNFGRYFTSGQAINKLKEVIGKTWVRSRAVPNRLNPNPNTNLIDRNPSFAFVNFPIEYFQVMIFVMNENNRGPKDKKGKIIPRNQRTEEQLKRHEKLEYETLLKRIDRCIRTPSKVPRPEGWPKPGVIATKAPDYLSSIQKIETFFNMNKHHLLEEIPDWTLEQGKRYFEPVGGEMTSFKGGKGHKIKISYAPNQAKPAGAPVAGVAARCGPLSHIGHDASICAMQQLRSRVPVFDTQMRLARAGLEESGMVR